MKKAIYLLILIFGFYQSGGAQIVNIPDANFKSFLLGNTSINTNGDTEIQVSEAVAYNSGIWVSGQSISSLTGIEAFANITNLDCSNNSIMILDLSSNTALTQVNANTNQLTQLNMANGANTSIGLGWFSASSNPNLTCIQVDDVNYSTTNWAAIDAQSSYSTNCNYPCDVYIPDANFKAFLLGNTSINTNGDTEIQCSEATAFSGSMQCQGQSISDLTGIEAFVNLTSLNAQGNDLISLDLNQNTALVSVFLTSNFDLEALSVSGATQLQTIQAGNCYLSSIDVSNNSNLTQLDVKNNADLDSVDISNNPNVIILKVQNCSMIYLNAANGNNSNFLTFEAQNNTNLTCIQVDDVAYSTTNWTNIDAAASFSTNCTSCTVNIPDANFKSYLVGNTAINTNGDTEIQCSEASAFTGTINCPNLSISDLTGIEEFTTISNLFCNDNQLTGLDLSANTDLISLNCGSNQLTNLTLPSGSNLKSFDCYSNNLSLLDLTQNSGLELLDCSSNQLTDLNVSTNTGLTTIYCSSNQLSTLNLNQLIDLVDVEVNNNALTSLSVGANPALQSLNCTDNLISNLNLTSNTFLTHLFCAENNISVLDLSQNTGLIELVCSINQLTALDVSANTSLTRIACTDNLLTALNVANGNNSNFLTFEAQNNSNLTCIQVDDAAYSTANWTNIDAQTSFDTDCTSGLGLDVADKVEVSIYPNPAAGLINIEAEGMIETLKIIDVSGAVVGEIKSPGSTVVYDSSALPAGLYIVQVTSFNGLYNKMFVKK